MRLFRTFLKLSLVLGAVAFTLIYLLNQWQEIELYLEHIQWLNLVVASILFVVGMLLLPLGVMLGFQFMHFEVSIPDIYQAYAVSQIAKYLPGSVWALPGRIFLYSRIGIPGSIGVSSLLSELILMIAGAAVISFIGLSTHMMELQFMIGVVFVGIIAFALIIRLFRGKPELLSRLPIPKRVNGLLTTINWYFSFRQSIILVMFYAAIWVVFGIAFDTVLASVGISPNEFLYIAGLFAAAWTLGFVVPIAPGGIGIREGVMVAGVSILVDDPLPVVVAVLSRILWMIAELVGLGTAYLMHSIAEKQTKRLETLHREVP